MELLNKASDSFFLLKKRLNPDDINELISSSNKSLVTIIKNHNKKPKEIPIPKKPDNKVLLKPPTNINTIGNKLASLLEKQTQKQNDKKDNNNKKEVLINKKPITPVHSNVAINPLPPDHLLNIAFNKIPITNNNTEKKDNEEISSPKIVQDDNIIYTSEDKNKSDHSPVAVPMNDSSDEDDEISNKKGDIFDNNMLSEHSDLDLSSPEIKPFKDGNSPIKKPKEKEEIPVPLEKKDTIIKNDNIIVNNTKISIPLEFFGDDKTVIKPTNSGNASVHKNPISSKHNNNTNVISTTTIPKVKQKSASSSVNKDSSIHSRQPVKSPSTNHPKHRTESVSSNNIKSSPSIPKIKTPITNKTIQHIGPIKQRPPSNIKENDSGIKKKEYDLVCLSMIENLTTKIKTRYQPSPNSSILKEFNEIQKLLVISSDIQKDKRIHIVTGRCIKIISILCNIFEDDKKKELYVNDVIQVLDVVGTFYHKAKGDFTTIPYWFKMYKLAHKYVYSLFSLKSLSQSQIKEMIKMSPSENKMKRLVKFAKLYKSYINSIDKLKMFLSKKGETTEDRKRKKIIESLIIYFETEPNAIKYGKCFKVSKKVIDLIIEYSNSSANTEII